MSDIPALFGPVAPDGRGETGRSGGKKALEKLVAPITGSLLPRVCLFTDSDVFAGTESHILDLAQGLRALGAATMIAAPLPSALATRAEPLGIRVLPIPKGGLVDLNAVRTFRRLLVDGQLDVIHAHNGRTALAAALAIRAAGCGKAVATQHFLEPNHVHHTGFKGQLSRFAHEWVARHIQAHIAISRAVQHSMLQRKEAPAARICVVLNGISPPNRAALLPESTARRNAGVPPHAPLLVCMARLEREKNIGCLVAAMAKVRDLHPDAQCLILGDGFLRPALQKQIDTAGVGDNVRLMGFRSDALSILAAADIFVLPSLAEPFGLSIVEAMALSKPVIATNAGGPPEIVEHQRTGLTVKPNDPGDLADAISRLIANPDFRRELAGNGYARYREHFTSDRMARRMLAVYQKVREAGDPATLQNAPESKP